MNMARALPSAGDSLVFVWWFRHVRGALAGEHGLYYSDYVFYPLTDIFLPGHISFPIAVVALGTPVALLLGEIAAFNACTALAFVLTALGTYRLVRYLGAARWASFIAGAVPAFAPFHYTSFVQGQLEAMSIQWFPFVFLYALKLKARPSRGCGLKLGIFVALVVLTSAYYVYVLFVFVALFVAWYRRELTRETFRAAGWTAATVAVLVLPLYLPILCHQLGGGRIRRFVEEFDFYAVDLLGFVLPASFHPLLGDLVGRVYHDHVMGTTESFLGLSVLGVTAWTLRRQRTSSIRFFGLVMLAFFVLSLGATLHVGRMRVMFSAERGFFGDQPNAAVRIRDGEVPAFLPGYLLHRYVPFFSVLRYPTRFQIPLVVAAAVLYGVGLTLLAERYRHGGLAVGVVALAVLGFEYLHPPTRLHRPTASPFYERLAREPGAFAILPVPIAPHAEYLYYQTVHGKKIMIGYMSVPVPAFIQLVRDDAFLYAASNADLPGKWWWGEPPPRRPLDAAAIEGAIDRLRRWDVRYVVYHRSLDPVRDPALPRLFEALARSGRAVYHDAEVVAVRPEDLRAYVGVAAGAPPGSAWSERLPHAGAVGPAGALSGSHDELAAQDRPALDARVAHGVQDAVDAGRGVVRDVLVRVAARHDPAVHPFDGGPDPRAVVRRPEDQQPARLQHPIELQE
jgi:hypothetical protein